MKSLRPPVAVLLLAAEDQADLERSLASLQLQEEPCDVYIVADSSHVLSIPAALAHAHSVQWVGASSQGGRSAALNRGLAVLASRGYSYVARLDAGAVVAPDRLRQQRLYLERDHECALVASDVEFEASGRVVRTVRPPADHVRLARALHMDNCIVHSSVMLRLSALLAVGFYASQFPAAEEYELSLRLSARFTVGSIPRVLTCCEGNEPAPPTGGRRIRGRDKLRVQCSRFEWSCIASYRGLIRSLRLLLRAPHRVRPDLLS